jgi:hypothetical protein
MLVCRLRSVFLSSFGVVVELDIGCGTECWRVVDAGSLGVRGWHSYRTILKAALDSVLICWSHCITDGSSGPDRSMDGIEGKRKKLILTPSQSRSLKCRMQARFEHQH